MVQSWREGQFHQQARCDPRVGTLDKFTFLHSIIHIMNSLQIILVILTTAAGSLFQGVTGLGLNLFASPLLMMIQPSFIPGPIMVGALLLVILMGLRDHSGVDLRGVAWMVFGMLPGTALASLLLPVIPVKTLSLLLGISSVDGSGTQPLRIAFSAILVGFVDSRVCFRVWHDTGFNWRTTRRLGEPGIRA